MGAETVGAPGPAAGAAVAGVGSAADGANSAGVVGGEADAGASVSVRSSGSATKCVPRFWFMKSISRSAMNAEPRVPKWTWSTYIGAPWAS